MRPIAFGALGMLAASVTASCSAEPGTDRGELLISKSTPLEFEAHYVLPSGEWAHVQRIMGLTATKMFVDTSSGTVYKNDGLGLADLSKRIGTFQVEPGSSDEHLLRGMLEAFLASGVKPSPSEQELGTPQYAAAYAVVEVLDINKIRRAFGDMRPMESEEEPKMFPYASWRSEALVPQAARDAIGGEQNGSGLCSSAPVSYCCGDYNCQYCEITQQPGGCAPSCAAGDHCNQYHSGSGCGDVQCGSLFGGTACGTAADQLCPHTCGTRYNTSKYSGCGNNKLDGGICAFTSNPCGFTRMQWETGFCKNHTPEGHSYTYSCGKWDCGVLFPGDKLTAGHTFNACDNSHYLAMQTDCNAVLYNKSTGKAIWASGTNGKGSGCYIIQQTDGNLIVYNGSNVALWSAHTNGNSGAWTRVQEDGDMVINVVDSSQNLNDIWHTNTEGQ